MMEESIIIKKKVRYFSAGNSNSKKLLLVLHGYGQLPNYFISKFESLFDDYFVIAPEGLHRFYLKGTSGRVGASWMTKEARMDDIEDNMNYLSQLLAVLNSKHQFESVHLLGFSQGAATAARFYYKNLTDINQLILWASALPPDLDFDKVMKHSDDSKKNHFLIGNKDEFYSTEQIEEITNQYKNYGFQTTIFNGTHEIDIQELQKLFLKNSLA